MILASQGFRCSEKEVANLVRHTRLSLRRRQKWLQLLNSFGKLDQTDILFWISDGIKVGDKNEALWRGFLAGHFGRPSADPGSKGQIESAGRFLCGFGELPIWTWKRISSTLQEFKKWLWSMEEDLRTLQYGNHRKFESRSPAALFSIVSSFHSWISRSGGDPQQAFNTQDSESPEEMFNILFNRMNVWRFGRTGRFDFLCLLGEMGILPVRPGSCYLRGSTGPLTGARKLWGKQPIDTLTNLADDFAHRLGLRVEIFEDALCNWQK